MGLGLIVEIGTICGSARPATRAPLRCVVLRGSCEPVLGTPARGGSAADASETMCENNSTGLQTREATDESNDTDIIEASVDTEIIADGGRLECSDCEETFVREYTLNAPQYFTGHREEQ